MECENFSVLKHNSFSENYSPTRIKHEHFPYTYSRDDTLLRFGKKGKQKNATNKDLIAWPVISLK